MNIALSTSVIQKGKTGIAQYVFALIKSLLPILQGHKLTLFVLEEDAPLFSFVGSRAEIILVPEQYRAPAKNIQWHQFQLPNILKQQRIDVLHVPSYRRLIWRRSCALTATIHDLAPFHVSKKYDWKRMLYGRVIVRFLAHRQHEIIAISQNTARDINHFFRIPIEKINIIYNGLEHDRFHPGDREQARRDIASRHGLNTPFFLYVARLEHPGKNHQRLISAFNRYKAQTSSKWSLVFAGSDWHGAEFIHNAIRQSPYHSDIRSLGFVPDSELPGLYRAASGFIYPSLYEGFGMPPIEAMACGTPVICSARGSLGEVVGDAALIVDPESEESMCDSMQRLSVSSDCAATLQKSGFLNARRFNWHQTAVQTLAIYEKAASRYTGRGN